MMKELIDRYRYLVLPLAVLILLILIIFYFHEEMSQRSIVSAFLGYTAMFVLFLIIHYRRVEKERDELLQSKSALDNEDFVLQQMQQMVNEYTQKLEKTTSDLEEANQKLRISESNLKELNATKDKFFSIVAHDLRNPFGNVMNMSELMMNDDFQIDQINQQEYIELIHSTAKQGFMLLENLLEWSRSQTGRMQIKPTKVDVSEFFHQNYDLLKSSAASKNILIEATFSNRLFVYADRNMINTVVRNLLSNAIKFTPNGGRIVFGAISNKDLVEISVKDNGQGIEKENLNKLFDMGDSYSTPGTNNEKGSGLGLILCKEFITKNDGEIWVESEPGEGSDFKFSLPAFDFQLS